MVSVFLICAIISFSFVLAGKENEFQEMLKFFAEIEDEYSTVFADSNYTEIFSTKPGPWFLFLSDPRVQKSIISNPAWYMLGGEIEKNNWTVNIGKIDISKQNELRALFNAVKAPTFIYIDNGYYYTYNGPTEFEDLKRIIEEKTYLQYDRKIFITDLQPSYKMIAKYYYIEYTAAVIGGIFVVALALLHLPNICSKKSKEKKE